MVTNDILHPIDSPMILPRGSPAIMAIDVPVATMLIASFCSSGVTTLTARGEAIDQNIEWATATPRRDITSIQ